MLYTEDFSMRHYIGFSQIGSHISRVSTKVVGFQLSLLLNVLVSKCYNADIYGDAIN